MPPGDGPRHQRVPVPPSDRKPPLLQPPSEADPTLQLVESLVSTAEPDEAVLQRYRDFQSREAERRSVLGQRTPAPLPPAGALHTPPPRPRPQTAGRLSSLAPAAADAARPAPPRRHKGAAHHRNFSPGDGRPASASVACAPSASAPREGEGAPEAGPGAAPEAAVALPRDGSATTAPASGSAGPATSAALSIAAPDSPLSTGSTRSKGLGSPMDFTRQLFASRLAAERDKAMQTLLLKERVRERGGHRGGTGGGGGRRKDWER